VLKEDYAVPRSDLSVKTALARIAAPAVIATTMFAGSAIMGTPAHAGEVDCIRSLRGDNYTVTDEHAKICNGRETHRLTHSRCVELLEGLGVRSNHAEDACEVADD
jgi:hypothetical protein